MGKHTNLILLDFSRAFDKVAHEKFIQKLHHYSFRGDTLKWIMDFFIDNKKQKVVIDGVNSDCIPISCGVPQGSVFGPILFLVYINELPEQVKSGVSLFADDTAMYLALSSHTEGQVLQNDLLSLEKWETMWHMNCNPSKCQVLHVTRLKTPTETKYFLHDTELDNVSSAKYLGVTISDDPSWSTHIDNITRSTNQTLGFLKRNIRVHNKDLKSIAYKTLVRPKLDYASTVWSPTLPLIYRK